MALAGSQNEWVRPRARKRRATSCQPPVVESDDGRGQRANDGFARPAIQEGNIGHSVALAPFHLPVAEKPMLRRLSRRANFSAYDNARQARPPRRAARRS